MTRFAPQKLLAALLIAMLFAQTALVETAKGQTSKSKSPEAETDQTVPAAEATENGAAPMPRLPRYFGKLGLDEEQRAEVLDIQSYFGEQIAELLAQIDALKAQREEELREVLLAKQVDMLDDLLAAAAQSRLARRVTKAPVEQAPVEQAPAEKTSAESSPEPKPQTNRGTSRRSRSSRSSKASS